MAEKTKGPARQHYELATTGKAAGNPAPDRADGMRAWDGDGHSAPKPGEKPKQPARPF